MKEGQTRKRIRRIDAKRTKIGRFLCRLLGDNAGQAMMEYVVLGVLVVAAVVALVVLFGENIGDNIKIMIYSLTGNQAEIQKIKAKQNQNNQSKVNTASQFRDTVSGDTASGGASTGE